MLITDCNKVYVHQNTKVIEGLALNTLVLDWFIFKVKQKYPMQQILVDIKILIEHNVF